MSVHKPEKKEGKIQEGGGKPSCQSENPAPWPRKIKKFMHPRVESTGDAPEEKAEKKNGKRKSRKKVKEKTG